MSERQRVVASDGWGSSFLTDRVGTLGLSAIQCSYEVLCEKGAHLFPPTGQGIRSFFPPVLPDGGRSHYALPTTPQPGNPQAAPN